jgi:uncharacterized oligopeptide transporter (OPT) family protein
MTEPTPQPAAVEPQPARPAPVNRIVGTIVVVALLVAAVWFVQDRMRRLERDVARRVQAVEIKEQQRDEQMRLNQDLLRDAQGKISVL